MAMDAHSSFLSLLERLYTSQLNSFFLCCPISKLQNWLHFRAWASHETGKSEAASTTAQGCMILIK